MGLQRASHDKVVLISILVITNAAMCFHMHFGHLCVFLVEMSSQTFAYYLTEILSPYWVVEVLDIFWKQSFIRNMMYKYFLPVCGLSFNFPMVCFVEHKFSLIFNTFFEKNCVIGHTKLLCSFSRQAESEPTRTSSFPSFQALSHQIIIFSLFSISSESGAIYLLFLILTATL